MHSYSNNAILHLDIHLFLAQFIITLIHLPETTAGQITTLLREVLSKEARF